MCNVRPAIVACGVGTRSWSLSRKSLPKQPQKFFSEKSQDFRKPFEIFNSKNKFQSERYNKDFSHWGNVVSIAKGINFQVKIIEVLPGEGLSLQEDKFRSKNWISFKGTTELTVNNAEKKIVAGEATFIPLNLFHRLENKKNTNLIIEVQTGTFIGTHDTIKHEDRHESN